MTQHKTMRNLKPCPLCQSEMVLPSKNYTESVCMKCGCRAPREAWNTRAAIAAMPDVGDGAIKYDGKAVEAVQFLLERGRACVDDDGYLRLTDPPIDLRRALWKAQQAMRDMIVGIGVHNNRKIDRFVPIEGPVVSALCEAETSARAALGERQP